MDKTINEVVKVEYKIANGKLFPTKEEAEAYLKWEEKDLRREREESIIWRHLRIMYPLAMENTMSFNAREAVGRCVYAHREKLKILLNELDTINNG